jgi:hypothetical protein
MQGADDAEREEDHFAPRRREALLAVQDGLQGSGASGFMRGEEFGVRLVEEAVDAWSLLDEKAE